MTYQKVSKTNEELSPEDRKMMSDIEVDEILFKARELARKIVGHVEFTSPIDKDHENKVMAKVKDVFKKEKLKLK